MDSLRQELREIRLQSRADFEMMTAGLSQNAKSMRELAQTVSNQMSEMAERMTQIEGRMRLHDQRFDRMLGAVEQALDQGQVDLQSLAERVTRLEQRSA